MKIYKVKKGKLETLKKWGKFLTANEDVVRKLLKKENCSREFFYFFKIANSYYVVGHMEGGPFKESSSHEINIEHKKVLKECLEPAEIKLENIYDIEAK